MNHVRSFVVETEALLLNLGIHSVIGGLYCDWHE
jgi:hypothetical protein